MVRAAPRLTIPTTLLGGASLPGSGPLPAGVVSYAQLATASAVLGRCPAGARAAAFPVDLTDALFGHDLAGITWPAANLPAPRLDRLGVAAINVATNGAVPAVEQARTVLENARAYPSASAPFTVGDLTAQDNSTQNDYQQLANTVILVSLSIAGCTLAAASRAGSPTASGRSACCGSPAPGSLCCAASSRGKRRPAARRRIWCQRKQAGGQPVAVVDAAASHLASVRGGPKDGN